MIVEKTDPTDDQRKNVDDFLELFAEVERALKRKLDLNDDNRTGVGVLITQYEGKNPSWHDSADWLRHFASIRNFLIHERSAVFGYPVAVRAHSVVTLRVIKEQLCAHKPVPARFLKTVTTVSPTDSLAHVVSLAFTKGFSQFPVVDANRFCGLITENEITRWLGRRVQSGATEIDLQKTSVRTLLKEKDPTTKGIARFRFKCLDAHVDEVMGMFSNQPMLEVVLLTQSGTRDTEIKGIITEWDAARFQKPQ